jgi:hypothetical protein
MTRGGQHLGERRGRGGKGGEQQHTVKRWELREAGVGCRLSFCDSTHVMNTTT